MDAHIISLYSFSGVYQRFEDFVLYLDQFDGFFRRYFIKRGNRRYGFAPASDLVLRHSVFVGVMRYDAVRYRIIFSCRYREYSGEFLSRACINA